MAQARALVVTGRILSMIMSLVSVAWLYRRTVSLDLEPLTVFRTVYIPCSLILVTLMYYFVIRLCLFGVCHMQRTSSRHTRRAPDGSPLPSTDSMMVRPVMTITDARLTIRNVWVYVFGLGLVFFIVAYCLVGLHPVCLTSLGLAVSVLAVDELICPRREYPSHYVASRAFALLCVALGLFMIAPPVLGAAVPELLTSMDIYSALFGMAFPFLSQLTLSVVRDNRNYTWRSVLEACEFGFPFTAFLGVFHLCVAYGQRQQEDSDAFSAFKHSSQAEIGVLGNNHTISRSTAYLDFKYWYHFNDTMVYDMIDTNAPFFTFYAVTPLVFVPACICFVWCILDGCAVDTLYVMVTVLCLEHSGITTQNPSGWDICALVMCVVGLCLRIACEYRPTLSSTHSHVYSMQGDTPQLPYFVVWMKRRATPATMQECEAETQELASDFPQSQQSHLTLA